ncbi:MAG: hypothetical protein JWP13_164 [Candidatus Saccharibacteria bacterium]|nr:hypothetical protein [Candidatus Saccharibacteria bacterium]
MSIKSLDTLPAVRPEPGTSVVSAIVPAEVPSSLITPILDMERTTQFMRCVPIVASAAVQGEVGPHDFATDSEVRDYKIGTGWLTPETAQTEDDYWKYANKLARFVGASFGHMFADPSFHDPRHEAGVALVMEHRRTYAGTPAPALENSFKPTFSGTTCFERNVAPDKFGAHLDLVHSSPILIGFIARGGGTIVREGKYSALDPLSSQAELNAVGDSLDGRQLPDDELFLGDARTLIHEAPDSQDGWRDHIRFYIAPKYPNDI